MQAMEQQNSQIQVIPARKVITTAAGSPYLSEPVDFVGDPEECDFCGRPLHDESFFADAVLPGQSSTWGLLCQVCTTTLQVKAGWGRAQFYARKRLSRSAYGAAEERWVCVAGGPPAEAPE